MHKAAFVLLPSPELEYIYLSVRIYFLTLPLSSLSFSVHACTLRYLLLLCYLSGVFMLCANDAKSRAQLHITLPKLCSWLRPNLSSFLF